MSAPVDDTPASSERKGGRSKSGCQTCRARKVRCDERPGVCLNCERLGLPCTGPATSADAGQTGGSDATETTPTTAGVKRKRTFRSCRECRATKTRCSGQKPVCVRCRQKSLNCSYDDSSEPAWQQHLRMTAALRSSSDGGPGSDPSPSDHMEQQRTPTSADYGINHPSAASGSRDGESNRPLSYYNDDAWWLAPYLPNNDKVRTLAEYYFANVHPIRCFGFLHKPSFMQRLDAENSQGRDDDALLLVVCALGALFLAAEQRWTTHSPASIRRAGNQWARRAQQLVLGQLGNIVVENLMTTLLLHDYQLRMSNFGDAFILSGLAARMQQALQINLEHSMDITCENSNSGPSASTKESRRRLMWCCYVSDSLIGNGVDQLTLIKEVDIKIQLPCCERNFLLQDACITETLERGQFLKFLDPSRLPSQTSDNMGIRAHYIRFISIRRKVLKYIKHLNLMKSPWLADSEFQGLDSAARHWYNSLPASLQFTPTAMYIRKETQQLGALVSLHLVYYQTMCDLYRICCPSLYKLRYAFTYPPEQVPFLRGLQQELFGHARNLALIAAEAFRHGPHALADCWTPTVIYDCCRVLLFHATQLVEPASERSRFLMLETLPLVRSNVRALKMMQSMYAVAELLGNAAEKMLEKVEVGSEAITSGHNIVPAEPYPETEADGSERSAPGTPVQSAPDYVLNPLSIYRMTRKGIAEKHMPERQHNAISPTATTVSSTRDAPLDRGAAAIKHNPDLDEHTGAPPGAGTRPPAPTPTAPGPTPGPATSTYGAAQSQAAFDDLLSLFASDPSGWTWQPSDTAIGSQYESQGLPPWEPTFVDQQLDAWVPMFSGPSAGAAGAQMQQAQAGMGQAQVPQQQQQQQQAQQAQIQAQGGQYGFP